MIFHIILFVVLCLSFVAQEFLPAVSWAYDARLFIVPVVFAGCSVSLPFASMLAFAFFTGFVWDGRHLVENFPSILPSNLGLAPENVRLNPAFGTSILYYAIIGGLMQGIRPLFRRGRWELPVLMTGVATGVLLVVEYLLLSFLRGSFDFSKETWFNIGTTSLLSLIISPLLFLFIHWLAKASEYRIRYEGLNLRRSW
jgi:hypothetical protein